MKDTRQRVSANRENMVVLHEMGHGYSELMYFKFPVRRSGFEMSERDKEKLKRRMAQQRKNGIEIADKLPNNLTRTRKAIRVKALCNHWDYMVTFTISPTYDRTDLQAFKRMLAGKIKKLNTARSRAGQQLIKFLLVFELHADLKAWHMHGFISGLADEETRLFRTDEKIPVKVREMIQAGREVRSWLEYENEIGYNTMVRITDPKGAALYATKYITKDAQRNASALGEHMYMCSRGLEEGRKRAGTLIEEPSIPADFGNEYVAIWRLENPDEAITINQSIAWDRPQVYELHH
jgi:hypothetical protein